MFEPGALPLTPASREASQIISRDRTQRITLLTSGLIRFETTPSGSPGRFENRASTFAINRHVDLPTPAFEVVEKPDGSGGMEITTDRVYIQWTGAKFGPDSLLVTLRNKGGSNQGWTNVWRYGDTLQYSQKVTNLGGTYRTLDNVDGRCTLEPGILSQYGLAMIDDTGSMLFTEDGWVAAREYSAKSSSDPGATDKATDVYLFAYGRDYREALRAFYTVSGRPPLIPRWSLGNWWSRYYSYSDKEFLDLMDRFKADDIPLSVAVLDIGWHPIDIDPDYGTGWTGYTWDKALFPDHVSFLKKLKERQLRVTLNTHPADGVRSHEAAYGEMCKAVGKDASKGIPVPFECTDKAFFAAYFEKLHHPIEDEGVDFWWLDWQQGPYSQVPSIDPLWMLNHYHFIDSGRRGERRFTFSRYAGPGSHRYPIGFSGDTLVTWDSLAFQPEFTATASNIGYGHWSHDIGGHYEGIKDNDLMARWVQSGCFSPFLRLHSSISPFNTREPWAFSKTCHDVCRTYLQLRHRLIPYLYSASVEAARSSRSLVEPVYYDHPHVDEAYAHKTQYTFGSQLMVVPVVSQTDPTTGMGKATGWLPPGKWVDVWGKDGMVYDGDRVIDFHRALEEYPVLAKEGAIIPLDARTGEELSNGADLPEGIEIVLVPGADGAFDLIEDDGKGVDLESVKLSTTPIRYDHTTGVLTIGPTENPLLEKRSYTIRVVSTGANDITSAGQPQLEGSNTSRSKEGNDTLISLAPQPTTERVEVHLGPELKLSRVDPLPIIFERLTRAQMGLLLKDALWDAVKDLKRDGVLRVLGKLKAVKVDGAEEGIVSAVEELLLADLG